jgi:tRNA-Thr(GGU) m(6)t(6)A37 methyltransferase TsaA
MSGRGPINDRSSRTVYEIGYVDRGDAGTNLQVFDEYRDGLVQLEGFSHAEILWWFSGCDEDELRRVTSIAPPFDAPLLGVFASHAPTRPNPVALSTVTIQRVDIDNGVIEIGAIDANDGSPLIDIKPYLPHYSRVESPAVPDWASDWPDWTPADGVDLEAPPA